MQDIVIIGAGIVGSFLAHDLSKFKLNISVVEASNDIASGTTMANSAIVHSGHDPLDGTLKAKLNVRGNELYEDICKTIHADFKRIGAYVVATSDEELASLDVLYNRAKSRNIPVSYIEKEELKQKEPNIADDVLRGISLPSTGIIYPWQVAYNLMEIAISNGVDLHLNEKVINIKKLEKGFIVETTKGTIETKYVLNAAGIHADDIYRMVSDNVTWNIEARRGEYFVLGKLDTPLVNSIIYPIPSSKGKGILAIPTTHGNVLLGPNSDSIKDKEDNGTTQDGMNYVRKEVSRLIKNIPYDKIIRNFAGLRPTPSTHDFIIEEANDVPGFINVAGIESPGLASAPAISEYVIETILKDKINLQRNEKAIDSLPPLTRMCELSLEEKNRKIKEDPRYGHIVCRCEKISEGEIVEAIHRPLPSLTIKAIKKRVRPGMGRCQGGFCEPLVLGILAREQGIHKEDVVYDQEESNIFVSKRGVK